MNSDNDTTDAIFSFSHDAILMERTMAEALLEKVQEANPTATFKDETQDGGYVSADGQCSELVLEDLKIQLGEDLFTIPSEDYAITYEDDAGTTSTTTCLFLVESNTPYGYEGS